jgi:hypothetical protein
MIVTDSEIQQRINEDKVVVTDLRRAEFKLKGGVNEEKHILVKGSSEILYNIILRHNSVYRNNFSVILSYNPVERIRPFNLRRYNTVHSGIHKNDLEGSSFINEYHIHYATERYQREDLPEDKYAEVTNRYSDISGALDCLLSDCNISQPKGVHQLQEWFR